MSQLLLVTLLLICSILGLSLVNFSVNRKLKKNHRNLEDLNGVNALKATFFVCSGLLISEVGTAGQEVLNVQSLNSVGEFALLLAGYISIFMTVTLVFAFLSIWFSRLVFSVFTKGKNIYEVAANSEIANIVMFAGILFCITVVAKQGFSGLLLQVIRYSETPVFH